MENVYNMCFVVFCRYKFNIRILRTRKSPVVRVVIDRLCDAGTGSLGNGHLRRCRRVRADDAKPRRPLAPQMTVYCPSSFYGAPPAIRDANDRLPTLPASQTAFRTEAGGPGRVNRCEYFCSKRPLAPHKPVHELWSPLLLATDKATLQLFLKLYVYGFIRRATAICAAVAGQAQKHRTDNQLNGSLRRR